MPSGTGKTISLLSLIVAYQKVSVSINYFLGETDSLITDVLQSTWGLIVFYTFVFHEVFVLSITTTIWQNYYCYITIYIYHYISLTSTPCDIHFDPFIYISDTSLITLLWHSLSRQTLFSKGLWIKGVLLKRSYWFPPSGSLLQRVMSVRRPILWRSPSWSTARGRYLRSRRSVLQGRYVPQCGSPISTEMLAQHLPYPSVGTCFL